MTENLEYQYDQVMEYIKGYNRYINRISMRSTFWGSMEFRFLVRAFRRDFLSGKNLEFIRVPLSLSATETERVTDYFKVATSDYPVDTLSDFLRKNFHSADFDSLKRIHDLRKANISIVSARRVLGFIWAGAALILKSTPKKVVEERFGLSYENFEAGVFWAMLGLLGYVLLVMLPAWILRLRAKYVHWSVAAVLEYTAIKYPKAGESATQE